MRATVTKQIAAPGWGYREAVTLDNSGGGALTDVPWRVDFGAGHEIFTYAQSDAGDVRFADADGILLDHWCELFDTGTPDAIFWVTVPSVAAGASPVIYCLYGQPTAETIADGEQVFTAFLDGADAWSAAANPAAVKSVRVDTAWTRFTSSKDAIRECGNKLLVDGTHYMWISAYDAPYGVTTIYVETLTSDNGTSWTSQGFTSFNAEDPYVIKVGDTWYMFFEGKGGENLTAATSIGIATSPDGITWTEVGAILDKGTGWEGQAIGSPIVVEDGGTYYLIYEGTNVSYEGRAGYATSATVDGTYTKYDGNPVVPLGDAGEFDENRQGVDDLIQIDGTWYFSYPGWVAANDRWMTGCATADDITGPWTLAGQANCLVDDGRLHPTIMFDPDETSRVWIGSYSTVNAIDAYEPGAADPGTWTSVGGNCPEIDDLLTLYPHTSINTQARVVFESSLASGFSIRAKLTTAVDAYATPERRYASLAFGTDTPGQAVSGSYALPGVWSGYCAITVGQAASSTGIGEIAANGTFAWLDQWTSTAADYTEATHELSYSAAGLLEWTVDDVSKASVTDTTFLAGNKNILLGQGEHTDDRGGPMTVYWAFVRKLGGETSTLAGTGEAAPMAGLGRLMSMGT